MLYRRRRRGSWGEGCVGGERGGRGRIGMMKVVCAGEKNKRRGMGEKRGEFSLVSLRGIFIHVWVDLGWFRLGIILVKFSSWFGLV